MMMMMMMMMMMDYKHGRLTTDFEASTHVSVTAGCSVATLLAAIDACSST
jgi:hypothetical protein